MWTGETAGGTALVAEPATSLSRSSANCLCPRSVWRPFCWFACRRPWRWSRCWKRSPANKRPGGDGREYLRKREEVLQSRSHLVELDLLRDGARLPMRTRLRPATTRDCEPPPPVAASGRLCLDGSRSAADDPRAAQARDADVPLDLQAVFTSVYDRARYDLSLNYAAELQPPLPCEDAEWMRGLLASVKPNVKR